MPVADINKDLDALTMTITAEFAAPAERVWEMWSDPRHLERWWGPPSFPATFVEHDFSPGGRVTYFMTGPDGQKHHGWWRIEELEPPRRLQFEDGFADEDGNPNEAMPTMRMTATLSEAGGLTTMTIESRFASREGMEQIVEMGMEQGMVEALGQIDAFLARERV
ncbi:MAG TPA: SRPBCC domain-containing protein [Solirubrobacteraceae bacterium]|nr:SRPBCC domain-containing protein [Solirubrobacteraceae bacterium]